MGPFRWPCCKPVERRLPQGGYQLGQAVHKSDHLMEDPMCFQVELRLRDTGA